MTVNELQHMFKITEILYEFLFVGLFSLTYSLFCASTADKLITHTHQKHADVHTQYNHRTKYNTKYQEIIKHNKKHTMKRENESTNIK